MVNIKHGCLSTLEENVLASLKLFVEEERRLNNVRTNAICIRQVGLANLVNGIGWKTIHKAQDWIGVLKCSFKLLAEDLLVKHVLNTQASTVHLIHIRWTDTALGGTNKILAQLFLMHAIEIFVIRHNNVSVAGNLEQVAGNTLALQHVNLAEKNLWVNNAAIANNWIGVLVHNTRWNLVKRKLCVSSNYRVACICTTCVTANNVKISGNEVGNFTLTLVSPLSTNKYGSWHKFSPIAAIYKHDHYMTVATSLGVAS